MNRNPYINGEYYHVYNRGVDKRKIFLNKDDFKRFLFVINAFNKKELSQNIKRQIVQGSTLNNLSEKESKLVQVEEYCLMPNHYHLLLRQTSDNGISKFLQRVMTSYTMYFNKKYERTGVFFQGRHKSKYVDSEAYLDWLKLYIHLNPLDLYINDWKEKGISKSKVNNSIDFLNQYKWVSFGDYSKYKNILNDNWESKPKWQEN